MTRNLGNLVLISMALDIVCMLLFIAEAYVFVRVDIWFWYYFLVPIAGLSCQVLTQVFFKTGIAGAVARLQMGVWWWVVLVVASLFPIGALLIGSYDLLRHGTEYSMLAGMLLGFLVGGDITEYRRLKTRPSPS